MTDPVELTAALIRCPSVTPAEGGAIALLERMLRGGRLPHRTAPTGAASPTSTPAGAPPARSSASTATPTWCRPATPPPGATTPSPPRSRAAGSTAAAPPT